MLFLLDKLYGFLFLRSEEVTKSFQTKSSEKKISEEINHEPSPDKNYGQILIKIDPPRNSAESARKIIEDQEIRIIEMRYLSPDWANF